MRRPSSTSPSTAAILVTNRSYDRALDLVSRFQGTAVPFEELPAALAKADIVVSSTSAPNYVLDAAMVSAAMAQRPDRPLLLVDLAVPRDIDPAALNLNSVYPTTSISFPSWAASIWNVAKPKPPPVKSWSLPTPSKQPERPWHPRPFDSNPLSTPFFSRFDLPAQPKFLELGLSPATAFSSACDFSAHPVWVLALCANVFASPHARRFSSRGENGLRAGQLQRSPPGSRGGQAPHWRRRGLRCQL